MSQATLLDVRGKTAGLVVGTDAGFRFLSSRTAFAALDGRLFPSVAEVQRAANALARRRPLPRQPLGRVA